MDPAELWLRRATLFSGRYWPVKRRMMAIAKVATATITIHLRYLLCVSFLTAWPRLVWGEVKVCRILSKNG